MYLVFVLGDGHGETSIQLYFIFNVLSSYFEEKKPPAFPIVFQIQVFFRTNQHFRPPDDLSVPLIMIGPGTGVGPFIGFLQEREVRLEKGGEDSPVGETWLLFGCRHEERDFLFR